MTTPKTTISEPYKHLRIPKAFIVLWIALFARALFVGVASFGRFAPGLGLGQRYNVYRHRQFALKQLKLSVINEMHSNSYTGLRLYLTHNIHRNLFRYLFLLL